MAFRSNERKFHQQLGGYVTKHTNNRIQKKPNDKKDEWINNMTRELERLEKDPKEEMHINLLKTT